MLADGARQVDRDVQTKRLLNKVIVHSLEKGDEVRNIIGSARRKPSKGSWKTHWMNKTPERFLTKQGLT